MRKELRDLKKMHEKPVSRMKKADISAELEKMRHLREITPPVAATPASKPKALKSTFESVKESKKHEFPVAPSDIPSKAAKAPKVTGKAPKDIVSKAVKVSKKQLLEMIQGMDSDAE